MLFSARFGASNKQQGLVAMFQCKIFTTNVVHAVIFNVRNDKPKHKSKAISAQGTRKQAADRCAEENKRNQN
jgi:hypothetical protein